MNPETIIVVNPETKIKDVLDVAESFSKKDIGNSYAQGWDDAIAEVLGSEKRVRIAW